MTPEEHKVEQAAPEEDTAPPAPPAPDAEQSEQPAAEAGTDGAPAEAAPAADEGRAVDGQRAAPAADEGRAVDEQPEDAAPAADTTPGDEDRAVRERADKSGEYLALAQRTQADFENYRKRMARELKVAETRGMSRLARELLPALDNLERAVAALEASDAKHDMADGIRLVTAELSAALGRTGIENFAGRGERFDPVRHEAVAQHAVEGAEPGTIVEVLQTGYRLNDSILRPARVIVAG